MSQLQCETLGGVSPRGKARVYFACHPEDFAGYFREITDDLLRLSDCAVYFYEDAPEQDAEYFAYLDRMQLIVIPVTTRLLYTHNRAMDIEFTYAVQHHIPVLPLMQEQRLEEKYAEKFGNLQFLDKGNGDLTAIPYEEKLKKYLDGVLLNDEVAEQIRKAFDAWVFLSYRKKDRMAAQELMKLIHSDPRCRDIAIWYDEFLNPGENFSDAIRKALEESQLFVMAVTPNLLEKDNYVMQEEFPAARDSGKPILPAEMEETDRDALYKSFFGIREPVKAGEDGAVSEAVVEALSALAIRENDADPKHNFFIGLAYLTGLFVEKDHPRAVRLIMQAADAGLTEAMEKLVTMYETGEGVDRDYQTAIHWREKLVEQAKNRYHVEKTAEKAQIYCDQMMDLGNAWRSLYQNEMASRAYENVYEFADSCVREKREKWSMQIAYRSCYTLTAIALTEWNLTKAKKWYFKLEKIIIRMLVSDPDEAESDQRALRFHDLSARVLEMGGRRTKAKECCKKALKIAQKEAEKGTRESLSDITIVYCRLGVLSKETHDLEEADAFYQKALQYAQRLADGGNEQGKVNMSWCCEKLAEISRMLKNISNAKKWSAEALRIALELAENKSVAALWRLYACYLDMADTCEAEGNFAEAKQHIEKAMGVLEDMEFIASEELLLREAWCHTQIGNLENRMHHPEEEKKRYAQALEICKDIENSETAENIGMSASIYANIGAFEKDIQKLETAVSLYKKLVKACPKVEQFVVSRWSCTIFLLKLRIENSSMGKYIFCRKKER